jgi:hypothetical protein
MRFPTPANLVDLAEAIPARYRALVFVGAYGGPRIGELAALRQSRVDLRAGAVTVAEILNESKGKLVAGPPNTRAGRRAGGSPAGATPKGGHRARGAHLGQLHPGRCGHQTIPWPVGEGRGHPVRD